MSRKRKTGRHSGRERSQRQLRVGELIRHALSDALARDDMFDPVLSGTAITVSEVQVSADLRHATVFFSPLACPADKAKAVESALNRCAGHFRGRLGREIRTKFTPDLKFVIDDSFENADAIGRLLRSATVTRDLES